MNYRKKYEKYYGVKLQNDMEVHHLDFNHDNNHISNLIALPKKLHQRYHKIVGELGFVEYEGRLSISIEVNIYNCSYMPKKLRELADVLKEMEEWAYHQNDIRALKLVYEVRPNE